MLKKSAKRFLALLCTISLIITGSIHFPSLFVVEAEDTQFAEMESEMPEGYRVVTPMTFGMPDSVEFASQETAIGEAIDIDNLLFSANVMFNGSNSHFYYLKGNNGKSTNFQLQFTSGTKMNFYNWFNYNDTADTRKLYLGDSGENYVTTSYITLNNTDAQVETFKNKEFQLWLTTEFEKAPWLPEGEAADDLKIGVWFNGKLYNGQYFYVLDCKEFVCKEYVKHGAQYTISSPIMELNYTGMVGGEYASETGEFYGPTTSDLVEGKVMNGTTFQTGVRFKGEGGTLYYGSNDMDKAVQLTSTADGIRLTYGGEDLVLMNKQNVGIDVLNHNFDLKLTTKDIDSDKDDTVDYIQLDISVDDRHKSFELDGTTADLTAYVGVKTEGDATVLVGDFASEEPEQISWDLDDGSYTIEKTEAMTRLSVDGVSVEGDVALEQSGVYSVAITENGKVYMTDVTIPIQFEEFTSEMPEGYRVVTPLTFGVPDATYVTGATKNKESISLDKLLLSVNVTYDATAGGTQDSSNGNFYYLRYDDQNICQLQFAKQTDTDRIYFYNLFDYSAKSVMYRGDSETATTKEYGSSSKDNYFTLKPSEFGLETFKGTELEIWITTEFVKAPWLTEGEEDDLKIGLWINGELYDYNAAGNDTYFYVLDCKENTYQGYVGHNSRFIISSPFMELDHMGMVGGEYASETGEFYGPTTSTLVENKIMDGTTFQTSVRFEGEGGTLYYGSQNEEKAIQFTSTSNGIQLTYGGEELVVINKDNVDIDVLNHNFDLKLITKDIDSDEDGTVDYAQLAVCVDNKYQSFTLKCTTADLTAYVGIKTTGDATVLLGEFASETPEELVWCLDDGKLYGVDKETSMTRMSIDGVATVSKLIDEPGTYSLAYVKSGQIYMQDAIVYKSYDLNDNNELDIVDILRMKKVSGETTKEATIAALSSAGRKAMGYEESTWTDEIAQETLRVARQTLAETVEIEVSTMELMEEEDLYAYGFDFLGGTQVMPIGGFNGPVPASSLQDNYSEFVVPNYISNTYFSLIEECGVNLILHSDIDYNDASKSIKSMLKLGEKYGIGITVKDRRYGQLGDELTLETAAEYLSDYQSYKAFCGVFAVDEPEEEYYYLDGTPEGSNLISNYKKRIDTLTELGIWSYANLLPYSKKFDADKVYYQQYVEKWLETCDVKMLMWDYYVHNSTGLEQSYFYNMSLGRQLANENNLPFWTYVQCGTQLAKGSNYSSTQLEANTPNEGQFMWNVNTCLAYGAKGISYFPLIQPASFAVLNDGTLSFSRNGLIGAGETDGQPTINQWYGYAQKANKQIAAIDDVLMNSVNKGVIITSDQAKADNQYSTCILEGTSWREMKSITGDVMVGCFNYQGKSAFYVVNYDMEASQNITMEFFDNYQFRVIQNATISRHRAGSCELSLEAGEGVLLVME